jgi:hypothetical protein
MKCECGQDAIDTEHLKSDYCEDCMVATAKANAMNFGAPDNMEELIKDAMARHDKATCTCDRCIFCYMETSNE